MGEKGESRWCERTVEDGNVVKHGPFVAWYEDGQKKVEGRFENGRRDGTWHGWGTGGQKISEQSFRDGEAHGPLLRWYGNGKQQLEMSFEKGEIEGPYAQWWPNGNKWKQGAYHDNQPVEEGFTCWDPDGEKADCRDQGMEFQ